MLFFKKKTKFRDVKLICSIKEDPIPVGSAVISDAVKISGKYYKLSPDCFDDVFATNPDMAIYIRAKFAGVHPIKFEEMVKDYYSNILTDMICVETANRKMFQYTIDFRELLFQSKTYITEVDVKDGNLNMKHVLHFHDNEDEIEGYFVFYETDFADKKYEEWFKGNISRYIGSKYKGSVGSLCRH